MHLCRRCGIEKPLSEFNKHPTKTMGMRPNSYCKQCASEYSANAQKADKANNSTAYKYKKRQTKQRQIMQLYGISLEDVNKMGIAQNWKCDICNIDISEKPYIDHDHKTKKVRALLCLHCNLLLGHSFDSVSILISAINYLQLHKQGEK